MKDAEVKSEGGDRREGKAHFKKKGGNKNKGKKQQSTADDAFRGVGFSIHREGPELYLRTIKRLGLYISTQFKNGADVKMCYQQLKLRKPQEQNLENYVQNPDDLRRCNFGVYSAGSLEGTEESEMYKIYGTGNKNNNGTILKIILLF